ncbi:MAG: AMP-binding protein, partial [Clostridia bacterium]|nr:AMP-binding protein [Clostridia bacterium]
MAQISGLNFKIQEMAHRIRELREIEGYTIAEMAAKTDVTPEEYLDCESGRSDLAFAFIYRCALVFGVDVTDIIQGSSPKLQSFTVTRKGEGQRIEEAHGMVYYNMAASFRNRIAEPLYVEVTYNREAEFGDIELTTHEGQECDIVIEGQLKVQVGEHSVVLNPGDSIYYDSKAPHGMVAVGGKNCLFYAIVLNPSGEPVPELSARPSIQSGALVQTDSYEQERVWHKYIDVETTETGTPTKIEFKNHENFNFAFDLIDAVAEREPEKLAMLHVSREKTERRITFKDMKRASNQCANYFKSLGIQKGDRVMLVLKRHYQFWYAMLGLNKLGAIAIPATNQLLEKDFTYRFQSAGVTAIICTADGDTAHQVDLAAEKCPELKHKLIVNGKREGWRTFDEEYTLYSSHYERKADAPGGDDMLLMFFTSGTSGYPKIAAHNHKYALGHFHTAKFWHHADPNGLHFTISDTGWAKSMWGKMYGQLLCEAAIFVYDFDRFDAADILPMFARYHITSFCAPPTMLRMMIKQDISKYDFSSVRHMTTAGEALNPEVYRQFEKATGLQIYEGFGQSESTMIIGNMIGAPHKVGSMGKPAPIYDVSVVDPDGNPVAVGETGEIVINVKNGVPCGLFTGYYRNPEKTAEVWHDGYY